VSGAPAFGGDVPPRASDSLRSARRLLEVRRLGTVPYGEALLLQHSLVGKRRAGQVPDTLLLLEHPHVITLGSSADPADVLADADELERRGFALFRAGRGGGVTYHGPGQLVAYPILDLKPDRKDLHRYLRDLEAVLIRVAAAYGVRAGRREGLTGVWTESGKLAAVGVRVSSQWISSHGVALNVACDLKRFEAIVPCGLAGEGVTSLERERGTLVDLDDVAQTFASEFAEVFDRALEVA
jgi:lipoyl(octanoyl) transferase